MARARHSYEVAEGHRLKHDPFLAIVGPRPIGWISTISREGNRNLAPYSFFNAFSGRPPLLGFASNGRKDTVVNAEATGEFVWNLATRDLAEAMNRSSLAAPPTTDEFDLAGLTAEASRLVGPPRVAESPVAFECRVSQSLEMRDRHGAGVDCWLTIGEVVAIHIDEALLVDGVYDTAAARPILRAGGKGAYFEIGADLHFYMERPID